MKLRRKKKIKPDMIMINNTTFSTIENSLSNWEVFSILPYFVAYKKVPTEISVNQVLY